MTDREENIYDMFIRTLAFNAANSGDYSSIPAAAAGFAVVALGFGRVAIK